MLQNVNVTKHRKIHNKKARNNELEETYFSKSSDSYPESKQPIICYCHKLLLKFINSPLNSTKNKLNKRIDQCLLSL